MNYGKRLKEYRETRGVGQQELAEELDYAHASQISRYESGELKLSRTKLAEAVFAIEKIVERRGKVADPAEVLGST